MAVDNKIVKEKKLDKEQLNLKVFKNDANERIFVEFSSQDGKLIVQKSFQDTYMGRESAKAFEKSIKSLESLRVYLKR